MRTPPRDPAKAELTVFEDPVTGTWTFQFHGHHVEVERTHGLLKLDGTLYPAPFVQGLIEVHELAGEPLASIARLIEATTQGIPPRPIPALPPPHHDTPAPASAPESPEQRRTPTLATSTPEPREQHSTPKHTQQQRRAQASTPPPRARARETSTAEDDERTMLTTEYAARYLGLSPKTLETMRTRGGGPPFLKLGRRVVYRKTDLEVWLAQRVRRSTSDQGEP